MKYVVAVIVLVAACAHQGDPPGGPPDFAPPRLIGTYPESTVVIPNFHGYALFRFDEVLSETAPEFGVAESPGTLEKLILLSPDTAVPKVRWERNTIAVEPKNGWKPNTVYRIELAPGLADLRNNVSKARAVLTFATGGPLPTRMLRGRAVDWTTSQGSPTAYIEAVREPEGAIYRTTVDSTGRFVLGPLPAGVYLVGASVDAAHKHRRDPTAPWDTVRVGENRDSVGEIWMFPRDTAPPKVRSLAHVDSVTLSITFTFPIRPDLSLPADSVRVLLLPDSATIGPLLAMAQPRYDSLYRPNVKPAGDTTARNDSTARRDSLAAAARAAAGRGGARPRNDLPAEKRAPLVSTLMVRTTGQIHPGSNYYVEVHGVRLLGGSSGTVAAVLARVDTAKARADSLAKAKTDSLAKVKNDSIAKAKADSTRRANGGGGGAPGLRSLLGLRRPP